MSSIYWTSNWISRFRNVNGTQQGHFHITRMYVVVASFLMLTASERNFPR